MTRSARDFLAVARGSTRYLTYQAVGRMAQGLPAEKETSMSFGDADYHLEKVARNLVI